MKYRILLILAVLSAASPIAADSIESIESNSTHNINYSDPIYMASSGGETVLGSALSEQGKLLAAEKFNGTKIGEISEGGQYQDIEIVNSTHIAYTHRKLTSTGVNATVMIKNTDGKLKASNFTVESSVTDIEYYNKIFYTSNSTSIFRANNSSRKLLDYQWPEDSEITDFEIVEDITLVTLSNPERILIFSSDTREEYNLSRTEDFQIIDREPLRILAVHEEKVSEYRIGEENISETWHYDDVEEGLAASRLSNNQTVISDSTGVFTINSTGSRIWSQEHTDISDIEHRSGEIHSLEGRAHSQEAESYWSSSESADNRKESGIVASIIEEIKAFFQ